MAYLLFVLMSVSACNDWPPFEAEAHEHFEEHRDSFDRLSEKMRDTDYWRVSIRGDTGVRVTPRRDGDYSDQFTIDDDPEWRELLDATGMFMVLQQNGAVWTDPGQFWSEGANLDGHNGFSHNMEMLDEFKICEPEHKRVRCGRCLVPLEDGWSIYYIWYPEYFSKEERDSYLNGETSLEDYLESRDKAFDQCHIDGYTRMGYDLGEILGSDET